MVKVQDKVFGEADRIPTIRVFQVLDDEELILRASTFFRALYLLRRIS
jgi:hypothetical protein